jgi:2-dehydro-3-deoxyphosphogluconate aldolase/(4S)-4-hydroxy-2-oxoglutarate aldolase
VNLQTAADFLRAGACALGIGSALVEPKAVASRDFERIRWLAAQYIDIVKKTRQEMTAGS